MLVQVSIRKEAYRKKTDGDRRMDLEDFAKKMNDLFSYPKIEISQVQYRNSWGVQYAYVEYDTKEAKTPGAGHADSDVITQI
jgi:hypothetical protein